MKTTRKVNKRRHKMSPKRQAIAICLNNIYACFLLYTNTISTMNQFFDFKGKNKY